MTAIRFSPNSGRIIEFGDITGGSAFNVTLPTGTTLSDVVDANAQGAQRGSGSPEGAVSARHAHDLYFRTSDSHVWYHAAGTTNTGWVDASLPVAVVPGAVLVPVADPVSVRVDTTTYDNPITGTGKLSTLVLPVDTVAVAIALEGDAFPRLLIGSDPSDFVLAMGDGTASPDETCEIYYSGVVGLVLAAPVGHIQVGVAVSANSPALNESTIPFRIDGGNNGPVFSGGTGEPGGAGNIGDFYFRIDGGAMTTIYRCTTAGVEGAAVWTGIL